MKSSKSPSKEETSNISSDVYSIDKMTIDEINGVLALEYAKEVGEINLFLVEICEERLKTVYGDHSAEVEISKSRVIKRIDEMLSRDITDK